MLYNDNCEIYYYSMMSAPIPATYSDIGKAASDLFSKDFPVGTFKLESKTIAPNGVVSS